jgi:hypothetical protein
MGWKLPITKSFWLSVQEGQTPIAHSVEPHRVGCTAVMCGDLWICPQQGFGLNCMSVSGASDAPIDAAPSSFLPSAIAKMRSFATHGGRPGLIALFITCKSLYLI